jgi:hypothetical protein
MARARALISTLLSQHMGSISQEICSETGMTLEILRSSGVVLDKLPYQY